jgi:1,4-alpha-glucan branching enzyme
MKKQVFYSLVCLCLWWLLPACSDNEEEFADTLTPLPESEVVFGQGLRFSESSSTQTLAFETGNAWTATLNGENISAWCRVNPIQGKAGKHTVSISVAQNGLEQERQAQLTFSVGTLSKNVSITQAAKAYVAPEGLSYSPEKPDADQPLTLTFKANSQSALYGYTGEVYVHIGVVSDGDWQYVPADWGQNIDKCKMSKTEENNTWSITLSPSIRQWFNSGETPVNKLGIVIRSADGSKKGIESDSFITVTDTKYKGFEPGAVQKVNLPTGVQEGINVIDASTVTFVLYDKDKDGKSKDYAYILGDFNNWTLANDESSQMYRDDAAGCWWITVSGLNSNQEYAFQYYVGMKGGESIRIGDPYCEKILDPNNDKYIPASTYADNITYPEKAKGIVSVFKTQKDTYTWSNFSLTEPEKLVIYELLFRDFTATGDIQGAKAKLGYLKEMGVNAIELMPTQEFDGNDSWGYNPCYFFAMDKAYGTKKDYKDFIDACHLEGIAVILDVVYNHATGEFPHAKLYWDASANKTAKNNPFFNVDAPHPYSVFHDFNHENEWVRNYVKRNLQFLLEEYNLDGFRFDLTKGFTQKTCNESNASNYDAGRVAILKDYHAAIKAVKKDAFVILEHFCDNKEESELAADGLHMWRNLNHAYCQTAMGYSSESDFSRMYESTPAWVGFMESHDEERMAYKQSQWGVDALKTDLATRMKQLEVNAAFTFTVPGPKMIWQFGEMGYDITIEENGRTGRKPLHWEYLDNEYRKALHDTYAQLLKLRNEQPELFCGNATLSWKVGVSDWANGRTLYLESITGKKLVVLGNFTHTETSVSFPADTGEWTDWKSGKKQTVDKTVKVPANSYLIYTKF